MKTVRIHMIIDKIFGREVLAICMKFVPKPKLVLNHNLNPYPLGSI